MSAGSAFAHKIRKKADWVATEFLPCVRLDATRTPRTCSQMIFFVKLYSKANGGALFFCVNVPEESVPAPYHTLGGTAVLIKCFHGRLSLSLVMFGGVVFLTTIGPLDQGNNRSRELVVGHERSSRQQGHPQKKQKKSGNEEIR